ncbi:hypothetical protein ACBP82_12780 [Paenalcaligenes hominis]|uniref:hypothetical protein n=1 Tax=Paenalcaligenes hominis TaxID=643674 RepID=UPI003524F2B2
MSKQLLQQACIHNASRQFLWLSNFPTQTNSRSGKRLASLLLTLNSNRRTIDRIGKLLNTLQEKFNSNKFFAILVPER